MGENRTKKENIIEKKIVNKIQRKQVAVITMDMSQSFLLVVLWSCHTHYFYRNIIVAYTTFQKGITLQVSDLQVTCNSNMIILVKKTIIRSM